MLNGRLLARVLYWHGVVRIHASLTSVEKLLRCLSCVCIMPCGGLDREHDQLDKDIWTGCGRRLGCVAVRRSVAR